jgi:type IV pilus biogenesis protein CpaD/CtpE
MRETLKAGFALAALIAAGGPLAGCAEDQAHAAKEDLRSADQYEEFGHAVREDIAAQIAYPEPHWTGPPPPTDGKRMELAARRYQSDSVIKTEIATTDIGHIKANGDKESGGAAIPPGGGDPTASAP